MGVFMIEAVLPGQILDTDKLNQMIGQINSRHVLTENPQMKSISISGDVIDWNVGTYFFKEISGNTSFLFTNMSQGKSITVEISSAVACQVNFPQSKWIGGAPQGISLLAGGTNIYSFIMIKDQSIVATVLENLR